MKSIRSPSMLTICLCALISLCPLGSTSVSTSLWGKKLKFLTHQNLWQLRPGVVVPALRELTVCMLLCRNRETAWTGFAYKAPGNSDIELGLAGTNTHLTVWLFRKEWRFQKKLKANVWYSVCLTWSSRTQLLKVYVNETFLDEAHLNPDPPGHLAPSGTLSLGASHFLQVNGEVKPESATNLVGEIGLFRMWAREWNAEELRSLGCADGDVLSWDLKHFKQGRPSQSDNNLHCAWSHYKIKMWTVVTGSNVSGQCSVPLEEIMRNWLESILPQSISVQSINVSSPSQACHVVDNSAAQHTQQPQELGALSDSTCEQCFSCEVYIKVDPAANVEVIQENMMDLLTSPFFWNFLNLTIDSDTISILPVAKFFAGTELPPTVETALSIPGLTQSLQTRLANISTTGEPFEINDTAVSPDTFVSVHLTLNVTGSLKDPQDVVEGWVNKQLEVADRRDVLNFFVKKIVGWNLHHYTGLMTSRGKEKQYRCRFHLQAFENKNVDDIKQFINDSLTPAYKNGSITIQTTKMEITHIQPQNCLQETLSTIYGEYMWPDAFPQQTLDMRCAKPSEAKAYRLCKLDIETDDTSWARADMSNCIKLMSIPDLDNITVTTDNAAEVVGMIQDLVDVQLESNDELSPSELDSVVEKLIEVVHMCTINPAVGANIVSIVARILHSKTNVAAVANIVLSLTERIGDTMDFQGESASFTAPSLALSLVNVDPDNFRGLTFSVSSASDTTNPEIFVDQGFVSGPLPETNGTISLPSALHDFFHPGAGNATRIQFQFYGNNELFQDPDTCNSTQNRSILNSCIISASINNSYAFNLKERVVVTLRHHQPKQREDKVQCMFWDFKKNGGQGGWNNNGCETQSISSYQTSCLCDHLTHFAVLLDVSRTPISPADSYILTVISYLGCGISSIFLGITLLTYLVFEKLRRDYPSKILINLSAALLGLNLIFLLNAWLSSFSNYGLCIATAATLHYFLLASFTWMGLEAVHMYIALVKVFNTYIPSYILKFCAVGWGVPLVIVGLVLVINKDAYGSAASEESTVGLQTTDSFCWVQDDVFYYATVVTFVLLIVLCNLFMFVVVLIQIRRMRANKPSANSRNALQDLRAVAGLTVLLGLTWSMGFFSFGPGKVVLMYLFTIFNTFHGFFVFLFHCLMKENVRKQWRIHLCCGRFRLSDYSDWSRSMTVGGRSKKSNLVNSESVASDNTSNSPVSE
ncbi:adhesion G-protein coupled receptor G4 isoform X2 [Amphiprion ocellaris]|uniref:adhesion G-protein coupled receptor G4 isoform X2 n=1 Tax=Amphiprion ocellaris TaxID=80972 RepID=UPI0024115891|nr:adhesion G-protein coupled receptor G4 isoform X2 [Amphiprion ocellaris]XP_054872873.1 adhesion G-protein coupled receptor G4 isoform X2 [Amphiprion ocellaris]